MRFFILCALALIFPALVLARIGVGIGVGKIQIDEVLKAGGIYNLPVLPVLNTGDEPADYEMSVQYHEGQEARDDMGERPAKEWFNFEPQTFPLAPGEAKVVALTLTLPAKVAPGNYFAYLEAHPLKNTDSGITSVGIAAASKLYFTIAPSNIFQGLYYRFTSIYALYHPWDTIILAFIVLVLLLHFLNKRFRINISKKI